MLCLRPVLDRRAIVGAPIFGNDGVLEHVVGDADWCALEGGGRDEGELEEET